MSTNVCIAYCKLYLANYIKLQRTAAFSLLLIIISIVLESNHKWYPDNCSPSKIIPRLGLRFRSRLGLVLSLGAIRQFFRIKIDPWLGLGF